MRLAEDDANMSTPRTDALDAALVRFVDDARAQASAAGSWNEERLTTPARDLLQTATGLLGLSGLTIVDKSTVTASDAGDAVGVPDLSVYDRVGAGRAVR